MQLASEECYKALASRDRRFDGVFFTCVKSTGIYCRPICPTHPPKLKNCDFVETAAQAERDGYRPCLRCRPELAPTNREADDSPEHRLCKQIEETLLIEETLGEVAAQYGVSERHLRRLFITTYGVEPKQYLTTRRLLFAKQLLQDTHLPIIDVAYSSGFNTPGRLTINMKEAYGFTPQQFRKEADSIAQSSHLTLKADYRPPFDWDTLLGIIQGRATPQEGVDGGSYHRQVNGETVTVTNVPEKNRLHIQLPITLSRQSHAIINRVRQLFDLDANPLVIQEALSQDTFLAGLIKKYPGLRAPGCWDEFELLVRVIIGQQISVAGATTIMRRLCESIGMTAADIAASSPASIVALGIPLKRATTIWEATRRVQCGDIQLQERDPQRFYNQLVAIPGIGPWTAEYLCLRVLHWPDAFPAGDFGVQKALGSKSEKELCQRSQAWRPWRSYATMLLWKSIAKGG